MDDIIAILIIGLILGLAVGYIYRAKKAGAKCIGCSHAKSCGESSCPSQKK